MKLGTKLAIAMIAVALLPLGVATYLLVDRHVKDLEADARRYNVATADLASNRIDDVVEQGRTDALKAAQVFAQATDKSLREEAARGQLLGSRDVHALGLYLPPLPEEGAAPASKVWGAHVEKHPAPPIPDKLSPETVARIATERFVYLPVQAVGQRRFLPVVFPVFVGPERRLYAYAWAPVDLTRLNAELSDISSRHHDDRKDQVMLVDNSRSVLAFHDVKAVGQDRKSYGVLPDIPADLVGKPQSFTGTYSNLAGEEVLAVVLTIPQYRWLLVVEQRTSVVYASITDALKAAGYVGASGLVLALLFGWLAARRLASPVVAVSDAASKVAGGDFDVRVEVKSRDEVGQMATAFNAMATDLKDYRARIVEEARVRNNLSRYLSNEVMDQVIDDPDAMKLGGERRQVTVMFADVVSFTRLTEQQDPEFLVGILNELFTIATEIVFKHGGIIDKFMGDSLMAVFGAPRAHEDDALRAITAGDEIQRWLEAGNAKWQRELGVALRMGIGVATGYAVAGNIGSERRMDYTVIGDSVNVAARLEGVSKAGQLLMDEATAKAVEDDFDVVSLGTIGLPGRDEPLEVFALDE